MPSEVHETHGSKIRNKSEEKKGKLTLPPLYRGFPKVPKTRGGKFHRAKRGDIFFENERGEVGVGNYFKVTWCTRTSSVWHDSFYSAAKIDKCTRFKKRKTNV